MTPSPHHGLLLLDKKSGVTSFDSLRAVKKTFATGKAGHTGTLDKFASGLLLVLVGRGLKLASLFLDHIKEYTGTIRFGIETDTLDPEGNIIAQAAVPSLDDIKSVLSAFSGNILQSPPAFSAVHIDGQRAHKLARKGIVPEMKKRPVFIHELKITSWAPPFAGFRVRVSAGTYIRSLARDIALAAGSRGYLTALKRTKVGPFLLENAAEESENKDAFVNALRPLDRKLFEDLSLSCITLDEKKAAGFLQGKPLTEILSNIEKLPFTDTAGVFSIGSADEPEKLLGVIRYCNNKWKYGNVFNVL